MTDADLPADGSEGDLSGTDLDNPYFDRVAGGVTIGPRIQYSEKAADMLIARNDLVQEFAWAIPNAEAIATIVREEPILEVAAGNGYWAWLVRQAGGDILPTDAEAPFETEWTPVWKDRAQDVVTDYPDRTLLMVWPPLGSMMAVETLGRYEGDTCIYVGESRGGATANDRFHEMLHEEWELGEVVEIPTYLGIRDRLEVWRQ